MGYRKSNFIEIWTVRQLSKLLSNCGKITGILNTGIYKRIDTGNYPGREALALCVHLCMIFF